MGYWAKDGSYQYDDEDLRIKEENIREQGKSFGFYKSEERSKSWAEEEIEKRAANAELVDSEYSERIEQAQRDRNERIRYEEQQEKAKEQRKLQRIAYEKAKARYYSLSTLKKLILKLQGKTINAYSDRNSVQELDSLFRGKSR